MRNEDDVSACMLACLLAKPEWQEMKSECCEEGEHRSAMQIWIRGVHNTGISVGPMGIPWESEPYTEFMGMETGMGMVDRKWVGMGIAV